MPDALEVVSPSTTGVDNLKQAPDVVVLPILSTSNISDIEPDYDIMVSLTMRAIDEAHVCWCHGYTHPMARNAQILYSRCKKPPQFTVFEYLQCNQFSQEDKQDLIWLMASLRCSPRHMSAEDMAQTISSIRNANGGKLFCEHK